MNTKITIIIGVILAVIVIAVGTAIILNVNRGDSSEDTSVDTVNLIPGATPDKDKNETKTSEAVSDTESTDNESEDDYIDVVPPDDIQPTDDPDVSYVIGDTSASDLDDNSKPGEENNSAAKGSDSAPGETSSGEIKLPVISF